MVAVGTGSGPCASGRHRGVWQSWRCVVATGGFVRDGKFAIWEVSTCPRRSASPPESLIAHRVPTRRRSLRRNAQRRIAIDRLAEVELFVHCTREQLAQDRQARHTDQHRPRLRSGTGGLQGDGVLRGHRRPRDRVGRGSSASRTAPRAVLRRDRPPRSARATRDGHRGDADDASRSRSPRVPRPPRGCSPRRSGVAAEPCRSVARRSGPHRRGGSPDGCTPLRWTGASP